jgi:hypothetical protein
LGPEKFMEDAEDWQKLTTIFQWHDTFKSRIYLPDKLRARIESLRKNKDVELLLWRRCSDFERDRMFSVHRVDLVTGEEDLVKLY